MLSHVAGEVHKKAHLFKTTETFANKVFCPVLLKSAAIVVSYYDRYSFIPTVSTEPGSASLFPSHYLLHLLQNTNAKMHSEAVIVHPMDLCFT